MLFQKSSVAYRIDPRESGLRISASGSATLLFFSRTTGQVWRTRFEKKREVVVEEPIEVLRVVSEGGGMRQTVRSKGKPASMSATSALC